MAVVEYGLAELVDNVSDGIRGKIALEAGDSDNAKYQKLLRALKAHDRRGDGHLAFPEFVDAMVSVNVVGPQRAIKTLFMRYDLEGQGLVNCERMASRMAHVSPDGESNSNVRNSLALLRRAAGKLGIHGASIVFQALIAKDETGIGTISRLEFVDAMKSIGIVFRDTDIQHINAVYDPGRLDAIKLEELISGIRGDGASTSYEALIEHLKARVPSWFENPQAVTHLALSLPHDAVYYADFVRLHQDFNAVITEEADFDSLMAGAWGIDSFIDPASLVLPGSMESVLQQAAASWSPARTAPRSPGRSAFPFA